MNKKDTYIGISKHDIHLIEDILDRLSDCDYIELERYLNHSFGNKITPQHYIVLGYIIGERIATYDSDQKLKQAMKLCQRTN